MAQQQVPAAKETALLEAATLVLKNLPPTYPFSRPPPNSSFDTNPLSLIGQLSALFSLSSNTSRRLNSLTNQLSSPLAARPEVFNADGTVNGAQLYMLSSFGGTTNSLNGATTNFGALLRQHVLDYHYRNTTLIELGEQVSSIVFGEAYTKAVYSSSTTATSKTGTEDNNKSATRYPSIGLVLSPNSQLIHKMRKTAKENNNTSLSVFEVESFLNSQVGDLLAFNNSEGTNKGVTNVFAKAMAQNDVRNMHIDVTNLYILPTCNLTLPFLSKSTADNKRNDTSQYEYIAEVDVVETEIIRVWRFDLKALSTNSEGEESTSNQMLRLISDAVRTDEHNLRILNVIFAWMLTKGFGNAKIIGVAIGGRIGPNQQNNVSVNITAQQWSPNFLTAATFRMGFTISKTTLKVVPSASLPQKEEGDAVVAAEHIDVWIHIPDHIWSPTNDMCKTHAISTFTLKDLGVVVDKASARFRTGADENSKKEIHEEEDFVFTAFLDALHSQSIASCEDRLCNEKDSRNVWLQHLRCVLPPSRQPFVFNDTLPPHRPGFAKGVL